jgi:GrpB-like predicted nucleotidyltransferase (UPF0157 family)
VVVRDVAIVAARPEWPEEYEAVAAELSRIAGDSILGVFHVGSTSVPGLAAKDVIDVQVRDYLRHHPETAAAYAAFELKAAALLVHDSDRYSDLKDPVCDLIYLPARQWAVETGWREPQ